MPHNANDRPTNEIKTVYWSTKEKTIANDIITATKTKKKERERIQMNKDHTHTQMQRSKQNKIKRR